MPAARTDSVRLALPVEAPAIAAVQRRFWQQRWSGRAAEQVLKAATAQEMTQAWHAAIIRAPQARCRVLVAVTPAQAVQDQVVGFAATVPSTDADATEVDGEIDEFVVDPPAQRRGHGSRLLHACIDTLRADGFQRALWWVVADDDPLRVFLAEAGWAPDGAWREIGAEAAGDQPEIRIKQIRMHTDLTS